FRARTRSRVSVRLEQTRQREAAQAQSAQLQETAARKAMHGTSRRRAAKAGNRQMSKESPKIGRRSIRMSAPRQKRNGSLHGEVEAEAAAGGRFDGAIGEAAAENFGPFLGQGQPQARAAGRGVRSFAATE